MTDADIRRCLINASKGESKAAAMPLALDRLDWANLDFLGWRDPKAPLRGYLCSWRGAEPVGIMLRAADSTNARKVTAMCSLCRSSRPANTITLFTARRAGASGRNGNTVGTYVCADFTCSRNVRMTKSTQEVTPDPGLTVEQRVEGMITRLDAFVDEVRRDS